MQSAVYLLSAVAGVCALWFMWNFAIRGLLLDMFRERLFELRFEFYRLGMNADLPFSSDVYRSVETLMCGLLRFGHRITFLTYIFSKIEQGKAKKQKDYVDTSQQLVLKISRLEPETAGKVTKILSDVHNALLLYMAFSSLFFLAIMTFFILAKWMGIWRPDEAKKDLTIVIEREAYRIEARRTFRPARAISAHA